METISTTVSPSNGGGKTNGGPAGNLAGRPSENPPALDAARAVKPVQFGGHKGGKKTLSGHPVDSAEHAEWCRQREAERSARRRAAVRSAVAPPPLQPVNAAVPPVLSATTPPATGASLPPSGGVAGLPPVAAIPVVCWQARDVEPLVKELVALTEELLLKQCRSKMAKAKLPKDVVAEIEKDLLWAERAKAMVAAGASELFTKQLNESNVPVEVRPWIQIAIGSIQIAIGQIKVMSRLDKIIAQNEEILKAQAAPVTPEKITGEKKV